eukprot:TRINITY_DN506_c0_g3_i1.p1 TRINITY_DN506_c0_g3~~TRINITY_DN506_c0_g3_i1.p1  ORF type:complete len:429 (+),score=53.62 TRINITY_DN506_c0_g3_i1:216-1502(+)
MFHHEASPLLINDLQKEQSFVALSPATKKVNSKWAIWNLFNDVLTPGTVGIPFYIMQSGIWFGCVLMVIFGLITGYTLDMVYYLSKKHQKSNYPDLGRHVFGTVGYGLVCVCIFLFNYGGLLAQLIMFGEVVPPVLARLFGEHLLLQRQWVLVWACIMFLPISFFRNIANYSITSLVSFTSIFLITGLIVFRLIDKTTGDYVPPPIDALQFIRPSVFSALGGISYIYVCHDLSFSVIDSLSNPTPPRYYKIVHVTMSITVLLTVLIGVAGYLLFYTTLGPNILDSFPEDDLIGTICRLVLALDICVTIPFSLFMPRVSILASLSAIMKKPMDQSVAAYNIVTVLILGSALGIAEAVTDLGSVFELAGGVSAATLAYILPPLIFIQTEEGKLFSPRKIVPFLTLILGFTILFGSAVQVVYSDLTTGSDS